MYRTSVCLTQLGSHQRWLQILKKGLEISLSGWTDGSQAGSMEPVVLESRGEEHGELKKPQGG